VLRHFIAWEVTISILKEPTDTIFSAEEWPYPEQKCTSFLQSIGTQWPNDKVSYCRKF